MELIKKILSEVKSFSRTNWWIYIIYLISLYAIISTHSGNIQAVILVTILHFIADIFIMMMFSAYARKAFSEGAYFQITSMLIFLSIKIYTGLSGGGWQYVSADLIYALAAIKNYRLDVKKIDIVQVNLISMSILSLVIILAALLLRNLGYIVIFTSIAQWVQTTGIFLFAIALSTTGNERLRYLLSIIALTAMVAGSAWETTNSIMHYKDQTITGLELSYSLLPLTVLVFYIKRWSDFIK